MPSSLRMPEYRKDPLSDAWVVIAAERLGRPEEFREIPTHRVSGPCPFCRGSERETPQELIRYGGSGTGDDWKIRVVPNKYPAVVRFDSIEPQQQQTAFKNGTPRLYTSLQGHGGHEVIIESPRHTISLTDLDDETAELAFRAYRDRMTALRDEGRWSYVQVFKNVGAAAGSSIEHAHSQVVGLPTVPIRVREELTHTHDFFRQKGRGLFETMIEEELAIGSRIVAQTPDFVALCPYASRFPYETWILPRKRTARFENSEDATTVKLAHFAREVIGRIERAAHHPAYNYLIHTAPFDNSADDHYHWHIEIIPRITKTAGFEWGTGYYINPISPEQAAASLSEADVPLID